MTDPDTSQDLGNRTIAFWIGSLLFYGAEAIFVMCTAKGYDDLYREFQFTVIFIGVLVHYLFIEWSYKILHDCPAVPVHRRHHETTIAAKAASTIFWVPVGIFYCYHVVSLDPELSHARYRGSAYTVAIVGGLLEILELPPTYYNRVKPMTQVHHIAELVLLLLLLEWAGEIAADVRMALFILSLQSVFDRPIRVIILADHLLTGYYARQPTRSDPSRYQRLTPEQLQRLPWLFRHINILMQATYWYYTYFVRVVVVACLWYYLIANRIAWGWCVVLNLTFVLMVWTDFTLFKWLHRRGYAPRYRFPQLLEEGEEQQQQQKQQVTAGEPASPSPAMTGLHQAATLSREMSVREKPKKALETMYSVSVLETQRPYVATGQEAMAV